MNLKIATRKSKLALMQTDIVIDMLKNMHNIDCEKILIQTTGDKILNVALQKLEGKGVFTKEIELALLDGTADAAVHSMKDLPFELNDSFEIIAIPEREDVRDVFVSLDGTNFFDLPKGAKIGTSSIRREEQLKALRPDIDVVPIRGNVQTRLEKIKTQNLNGTILAAAGLKRLGMQNLITNYFDPHKFIPAVGQGALGIEISKNCKCTNELKTLDSKNVRMCVDAERSFMARLNGGCHTSTGAYATIENNIMHISGIFKLGNNLIKKDIEGNVEDYINLGKTLAENILACE